MTGNAGVVLLVDDDEAKRYLMGTWLRRGGHTVIEAGTGKEALEKAGSAELILLDVNLPDMLGYDVCRQIKADPATAAIPVVQVSATAVQVYDRARAAGAARIFAAQAVLVIEMPDGQIRRTSASPERPAPRQRGAPRGLTDLVTARILADSQVSAAITLSRED